MSDIVLVALIAATPGTLGVFVSLFNGWKLRRLEKNTDGMKEELVAEVRKASFAAGKKSETDKR